MESIDNVFEYATRNKLRYSSSKGEINTEDLWTLSPETLDCMGIKVKEELEKSYGKTLRSTDNITQSNTRKELEVKLAIIQHILNTKDKENAKAQEQNRLTKELNQLKLILKEKKGESLRNMSLDDIENLITLTQDKLDNIK